MISTTNDYQKLQARARNVYVFISGCRSLSQSLGVSFFKLGVAKTPTFAVGIVILPVMVQEIYVFPVLTAVMSFPAVGHCHNHLGALYSDSLWSEIPDLPL